MQTGSVSDWPKRIHFGHGAVDRLSEIVRIVGGSRAMVVCGRTVASGEMLELVRAGLGPLYAGVFTEVRAHTPREDVERAAAAMRDLGADTIITVGGGSAIDAGKGIVLLAAAEGDLTPYAIEYASKGMKRQSLRQPHLRHVAVPTTAGSASDVMPTAGIRDSAARKKMLFWDAMLVPDATVLDPRMASFAGPELTAASGMTAVARAIESLYSHERNPIATGLALHAARMMRKGLIRSVQAPDDLVARAACQHACVMSGMAAINSMVSVVHAIGHVVGGRYSLQHGISHSMLLAPALRKLLPAVGEDSSLVLDALGCPLTNDPAEAAGLAADAVQALLNALPLPQRLREVGVGKEDLPELAALTMGDYMMANLPTPLDVTEVQALLAEAW